MEEWRPIILIKRWGCSHLHSCILPKFFKMGRPLHFLSPNPHRFLPSPDGHAFNCAAEVTRQAQECVSLPLSLSSLSHSISPLLALDYPPPPGPSLPSSMTVCPSPFPSSMAVCPSPFPSSMAVCPSPFPCLCFSLSLYILSPTLSLSFSHPSSLRLSFMALCVSLSLLACLSSLFMSISTSRPPFISLSPCMSLSVFPSFSPALSSQRFPNVSLPRYLFMYLFVSCLTVYLYLYVFLSLSSNILLYLSLIMHTQLIEA